MGGSLGLRLAESGIVTIIGTAIGLVLGLDLGSAGGGLVLGLLVSQPIRPIRILTLAGVGAMALFFGALALARGGGILEAALALSSVLLGFLVFREVTRPDATASDRVAAFASVTLAALALIQLYVRLG